MRMIPRVPCHRPGALTCHTYSSSVSLNLLFRADYETRESVYYEIGNRARGCKGWWRGNSSVACLPSDTPNVRRGRNRISKAERKAMLESFVNRYREMNAGKFPTHFAARKHVGGSFYIIRQIMQELKHNAICSQADKPNDCSIGKEVHSQIEPQFEARQVSGPHMEINDSRTMAAIHVEAGDAIAERNIKNDSRAIAVNHAKVGNANAELNCQSEPWLEVKQISDPQMKINNSQTIAVNHLEAGDANAELNIKNDSQAITANHVEVGNANAEQNMKNDSQTIIGNHVGVDDTNLERLKGREGTQASPWTIATMLKGFMKPSRADDESVFVATKDHQEESQTQEISCPSVEKEEASYEDSGHKGKQGSQVFLKSDNHAREISEKDRQEEQFLKRSTLWGNLKLLANGIISKWKKK